MKKRAQKVAHNRPGPSYFTVQPRQTAHSPELIFHIMKSQDQTSVLLSVGPPCLCQSIQGNIKSVDTDVTVTFHKKLLCNVHNSTRSDQNPPYSNPVGLDP